MKFRREYLSFDMQTSVLLTSLDSLPNLSILTCCRLVRRDKYIVISRIHFIVRSTLHISNYYKRWNYEPYRTETKECSLVCDVILTLTSCNWLTIGFIAVVTWNCVMTWIPRLKTFYIHMKFFPEALNTESAIYSNYSCRSRLTNLQTNAHQLLRDPGFVFRDLLHLTLGISAVTCSGTSSQSTSSLCPVRC
jgi:hypothetical protein